MSTSTELWALAVGKTVTAQIGIGAVAGQLITIQGTLQGFADGVFFIQAGTETKLVSVANSLVTVVG